jgi:hypothetical protein
MSIGNGAFVHVRQSRRCRARSAGVGGGFIVQFFDNYQPKIDRIMVQTSYPTHDSPATLTLSHHITSTYANTTSSQPSLHWHAMPTALKWRSWLFTGLDIFVDAMQRVLDKLATIFEQVGAELPTRA